MLVKKKEIKDAQETLSKASLLKRLLEKQGQHNVKTNLFMGRSDHTQCLLHCHLVPFSLLFRWKQLERRSRTKRRLSPAQFCQSHRWLTPYLESQPRPRPRLGLGQVLVGTLTLDKTISYTIVLGTALVVPLFTGFIQQEMTTCHSKIFKFSIKPKCSSNSLKYTNTQTS